LRKFLALLLLGLLAWEQAGGQQKDPFRILADGLLEFFRPLEGQVVAVEGDRVEVAFANSPQPGIRVRVLRRGEPFLHPITKEPIGVLEEPVGLLEVLSPREGRLLEGEAQEGDVLRLSRAPLRLLFYQLKGTSWALAEQYYRVLKETGRFELLSSPEDEQARALPEARRLKADAVLLVSQEQGRQGRTLLRQRLLWPDGKEALRASVELSQELVAELTLGEELFSPREDVALVFKVPYGAELICWADLDGDGEGELLVATQRRLMAYHLGPASLLPLEGAVLKGPSRAEFLWLQAADIDDEKGQEVLLSARLEDSVGSFIYKFKDGSFIKLWEGDFLIRHLRGRLYGQRFSRFKGPLPGVFELSWQNGKPRPTGQSLKLPPGVNLYDFILIGSKEKPLVLSYDDDGYLNLFDHEAMLLWRSSADLGGVLKSFELPSTEPTGEAEFWSVKDRLLSAGGSVLAIWRQPIAGKAKGLGYKRSGLLSLRYNGLQVEKQHLIEPVAGKVLDFALAQDRLMVLLSPPLGLDLKRLLKARSPFTTYLYVYPLEALQ
jgi:hypothetical protein